MPIIWSQIDHFFHYILTTSCLLDIEFIWRHLFYLTKTQRQNIFMPTSAFPRSHKHFLSICWWDCLCKLVLENAVATLGTVNQTFCCFYCDVYRVLISDYQLKINICFFQCTKGVISLWNYLENYLLILIISLYLASSTHC